MLRGLIATQSAINPVIRVNEVTVNLDFSLADASGRMISDATAQGGSFSGSDVRTAAARLINEQADDVVSKLYSEYCTRAVIAEPPRKSEPARKK